MSKSKNKPKTILKIFCASVVLTSLFILGYIAGNAGYLNPQKPKTKVVIARDIPENKELNFDLFWKVWDTVENNYFDKSQIDESGLVYGAIKGMVAAVGDPYTVFLTPRENQVVTEDLQGNFEGVGIQIGFKGKQLAVVAPLPGTPAEEAGIQAGDYIIGIKDEEREVDRGTVGISLPEAVKEIRGPAGSTVTLALLREGSDQPIIVDVVRQSIDIPSVTLKFVGQNENIAHVRILKFGAETVSEWDKEALEILKKQDLAGIIIDVRNDTGGYMQAAIDIASDFVELGNTVVIQEEAGGRQIEFKSEKLPKFGKTPVVILINPGSASASEILAGALKDDRGAKLVGQTSFGKGTIQETQDVDGGAGLHITIARWLTPSGYWVNGIGLDPDVVIEDNPQTPEDEQLQKAIEQL